MKKTLTLMTIGAALTFTARADLSDNFDSYTSKAEFDAVWTPTTGTGLNLNTSTFQSAPNSVMNPGTAGAASAHFMTPIAAPLLSLSYEFYDFNADNTARDFVQVQSRVGTTFAGALNQLLAIGKYNNIVGNSYYGRVAFATGAVYGDGASTPNASWFQLGGAADRSVGWHTAAITAEPSTAYPGMVRYEFYIDGVLGGSVDNMGSVDYNWTVLGSGLSIGSTTSPIAFDNLAVTAVPEPSSLALALMGGFGLFIVGLRRQ